MNQNSPPKADQPRAEKFKIQNYCWKSKLGRTVTLLLLFLIIAPVYYYFTSNKVAAWFDENWHYRKSIKITNSIAEESDVYNQ